MKSRVKFWPILASVFTVCVITCLLALAKPHCKDSALKLALVLGAYIGQWLLVAAMLGLVVQRRGLIHGLIFGVAGSLLSAVLWLGLLWGWHVFTLQFYWNIWSSSIITALPLAALGGWLGSFCHAKYKRSDSAA